MLLMSKILRKINRESSRLDRLRHPGIKVPNNPIKLSITVSGNIEGLKFKSAYYDVNSGFGLLYRKSLERTEPILIRLMKKVSVRNVLHTNTKINHFCPPTVLAFLPPKNRCASLHKKLVADTKTTTTD